MSISFTEERTEALDTAAVEQRSLSAQAKATDVKAASRAAAGMAHALQTVRLLLAGVWLGAALFFSFSVAPSAFTVLRASPALYANHLAGSIVTRTLAVVNTSGFIISLLLLAGALLYREGKRKRAIVAEIAALAVVALMTGVGQWVIAARMLALRLQMGRPIDETAMSDPLRASFNSLHGYSVAALLVAMIAALVAFVLIARRARTD